MTMTITISDSQAEALKAKAQSHGMSAEDYAREVLEHELASAPPPRRHISDVIADNMRDMPPEVLAKLPTDGASEHDHYLYGHPKRHQ